MELKDYIFRFAPRAPLYALARRGLVSPPNPLAITYSVTAACRSLCKTCNIGRCYLDNPELARKDLSLEEVEKVFKSLGPIYFFNVSGGEPFMRMDLAEICRLAFIHLKPRLISIPTNSLAPRAIEQTTVRILDQMERYLPSTVLLSIKPSIDGIGEMHDYIRGVKGNFVKLEETIDRLLALRSKRPRLIVDLGTVISNYNIHHLGKMEDWVHNRGIESYRHEIAEQRVEFHNIGDPITPPPDLYEELTREFTAKIISNIKSKAFYTRVTEAVRIAYYDVAVRIMRERRQVTPCYGGLSNIHMDYDGEMWPCCILGGEQSMGNVRDWEYDAGRMLASPQAKKVIRYIAGKNCACPLASQWLNNVLLSPRHMLNVLHTLFIRFTFAGGKMDSSEKPRAVDPKEVRVDITGTSSRQALVQGKAGVIPEPEEAELPEFGPGSGSRPSDAAGEERPPGTSIPAAESEEKRLHRIQEIRRISATTYTLRIDREGIEFIPGQYAVLGRDGCGEAREYTIYSSTGDDFLEFLITVVDGGAVSGLLRTCTPDDRLTVDGPMGYFHLDTDEHAATRHVFIATGSGIAPFHSFVRSFPGLDYTVLHGVRTVADCHDREAYAGDRYISCVSREEGGHFQGRVTGYLKEHPLDAEAVYYLCGNCDMIYEAYDILVEGGISRNKIRTEVFY